MATSKLTMILEMNAKMFKNKLTEVHDKFSKSIGKMQVKYQDFIDGLGANNMLDSLKNPALVMGGVAVAVGGFMAKSTQMANDWHKQMAEINVTAGMSKNELQGLSDELLKIGTRNVAPLEEVPKAFQRIISAGLDVNTSLKALEPTMRAAKAGFTDIETVASAGIATMMSSGKDINHVYDVLFATVKEGNAEFKDIAHYLPKVIPIARSIGYELEATAGAYASLTTKLSAEQSSTALEGVMRTLSNADIAMGKMDSKTGKYASGFRSIGMNIFDSTGKIRPLVDIVGELNKKFEGLTDEQKIEKLSKLGFDQATALGFGTMMQDVEGLRKATMATTFAQGVLNKAYMDSLTPLEQWGIIQNNIKGTMIKLGEKILPYVTSALEKLTPVFQWLFANIDTIIPVVGTFIGVLGGLAAAVWVVNLALWANPITWIIAGIAALIAVVVLAIKKFDDWGAALLLFIGPIGLVINMFKSLYDHWDSIKKAFQTEGIIGGLKRLGWVILDALLKPFQQILEIVDKVAGTNWAGSIKNLRQSQNLVTDNEKIQSALGSGKLVMYNGNPVLPATKERLEKRDAEKQKNSLYTPLGSTTGGSLADGVGNLGKAAKGKKKLSSDVDKISGAAKEVKNITIKFDSVHKGDNIINNGGSKGMSMQDFENFYNEMMMRIIRNAETS